MGRAHNLLTLYMPQYGAVDTVYVEEICVSWYGDVLRYYYCWQCQSYSSWRL